MSMEIKVFNVDSPDFGEETAQKLLSVSTSIFYPTNSDADVQQLDPNNSANKLEYWLDKLKNQKGEIIYAINQETGEIAAFTFTCLYPNSNTSPPEQNNTYHIWIAGCKASFRRQGIMSHLFDELEQRAQSKGYERLTVNTYPHIFRSMPKFLEARKFELARKQPLSEVDESSNSTVEEKWSYSKVLL